MKKNYLLMLFFAISAGLQAQIFSSGFEDNNGTPLSEFKIVNNDSLMVPEWGEVLEFNEEGWIQFFDGPDNKIAFSTSYYAEEGPSDDWLITPAIEIPEEGTPTLYWKAKSYDIENMEDYDVRISVADDELESFEETLLSVTDEQAFDFNDRQLDLSDYKGQTVYIAFVNVTDGGYYLAVDDLYISTSDDCILPNLDSMEVTDLDEQGFTVSWTNEEEIASFDTGLTTFDVPVSSDGTQATTTKTYSDLEPGTRYQFFLKNDDCGSGWASPRSIMTAIVPPYAYDFEYTDENFGEYDSDGWSSDAWVNSSGGDRAQSGDGYIFNNTSATADSDAWIYSPALKLEEGEELVITYHAQLAKEIATPAELEVVVAGAQAKAEHLETLDTQIIEGDEEEYQELTVTYAPTETGVYYIGFGNVTPQVQLDAPLRLDNIQFDTQELGLEIEKQDQVKVYPNPIQGFLHIQSAEPIEAMEVYGLDGKLLDLPIENDKIDFSALADGVYFVKIETASGSEIKKVVK